MEDAEDPVIAQDLLHIHSAGSHLLSLINDVLDLAKIEAGKTEIDDELLHLAGFCQSLVSGLEPLAAKNNNALICELPPNLGTTICDSRKLRQALLNVLGNAFKFTQDGTITFRVSVDDEWVRFEVEDTGIGMTESQCEQVFGEFIQADDSTTRRYGGTGLGLAISRGLCQLMGGDLVAQSELGHGTIFTVQLPLRQSVDDGRVAAYTPLPAVRTDGSKVVLIVDDDVNTRALMHRYLQNEGYQVVSAVNGAEGIRLAREHLPDLIALDVVMPDMQGWDVLKVLKATPELAGIPVVMTTMLDEMQRGLALGASDYLVKPVGRDRLLATLRRLKLTKQDGPILIVDDDDNIRALVGRFLRGAGWEVLEAETGRVALNLLEHTRPSVVMLDLMMPEADGFEVVATMQAHAAWCSIPVIVITAMDVPPARRALLEKGVATIITKHGNEPTQMLDLIRANIDRVMSPS